MYVIFVIFNFNFLDFKYSAAISFLDLQLAMNAILYELVFLLFFFFIGEKLRLDLMNLADMIYQLEWYRQSRYGQRFIILMMMRAQQPFHLSAYGIFQLELRNYLSVSVWKALECKFRMNRRSFQVLKSIYSALMVLRSME